MGNSSNILAHERQEISMSDTMLVILSGAAGREDCMLLPLPDSVRLRGGARNNVLRKLLRQDLIEEVAVSDPEQAWRTAEDGCRVGLQISAKGLRAIRVEDGAADVDSRSASTALVDSESPPPAGGPEGGERHGGARASSSSHAAKANAAARSLVRPSSKQALLLERLSSGEGCTLDELARLLGWQRHTVRAALTGLRQKGFRVTKSKSEEGETRYHAFPCPTLGGSDTGGRLAEGDSA